MLQREQNWYPLCELSQGYRRFGQSPVNLKCPLKPVYLNARVLSQKTMAAVPRGSKNERSAASDIAIEAIIVFVFIVGHISVRFDVLELFFEWSSWHE